MLGEETSSGGEIIQSYLGGQVAALRRRIEAGNVPGNVEGLFARHVLGPHGEITWDVDPLAGSWLTDNRHQLLNVGPLAAVGYALRPTSTASVGALPQIQDGLNRLRLRDQFRDRISFLHNPSILTGVTLAVVAVRDDVPDIGTWLVGLLNDPRLVPTDLYHALVQKHALAILGAGTVHPINIDSLTGPGELALACWMLVQGTARLDNPAAGATLHARALRAAMSCDPASVSISQAALLTWAVDHVTTTSIDQAILSRQHLSLVLGRFEAAMRRWRWDLAEGRKKDPIRWPITAEREVQDILYIILRSVFDDVVDEETLPKFGHGSTRADFGIPSLRVLIEVKYARSGSDFKDIEQEIMIDSVAYLQKTELYKEIVAFIYDASAAVEHHDVTRRALLEIPVISDVLIVSRPATLAAATLVDPTK